MRRPGPQADARSMFTAAPDLVLAAAADHRRALLDDAAQHRLARLAARARRRRAGRAAEVGPLRTAAPVRLGPEPAPKLSGDRASMTDVARLGVGIELVGRRRGARDAGRCAGSRRDRPAVRGAAGGDAGVGKSRLLAEVAERGRALGHPVLVGRCLDTAESALPYLPFTEIVGRLAEHPARAGRARTPRCATCCPATPPAPSRRVEDRGFGQVRVFDAVLSVLDELTATRRRWSCWRTCTGPTGRAGDLLVVPAVPARRAAAGAAWPPTAPTTCTGGTRCARCWPSWSGCPPSSGWSWRRSDAGRHAGVGAAAGRRAAARARACAGPPGAARATRSSPRSWSSASGTDGDAARAGRAAARPDRGARRRTPSRCCGSASVAGRRVRHEQLAAVSGLDDRRAGAGAAGRGAAPRAGGRARLGRRRRRLRVPARAAARGGLRRAAARRAEPDARRATPRCSPRAEPGPSRGGPPSSPTTRWPGTTCRWRWPPRCGRPARPTSGRRPAELLLHAERALELWPAVPDAGGGRPASTRSRLTRWAAWGASATGDPERGIALGRRALELAERCADPSWPPLLGRRYALRLLDLGGREEEALRRGAPGAGRCSPTLPATGETGLGARGAWPGPASGSTGSPRRPRERRGRAGAVDRRAGRRSRDAHRRERRRAGHAGRVRRVRAADPRAAPRQRLGEAQPLARRAGNLGGRAARLRTPSACRCSTRAGSPRPATQFADGERAGRGDRHHLERRTGSTCGSVQVVARFMRGDWDAAERPRPSRRGVGVGHGRRPAGRGRAARRGRPRAASTRRTGALTELRDSDPADDQVIMLLGQAGAEAALWQGRPEAAPPPARRDALAGLAAGRRPAAGRHHAGALGVAAHRIGRRPPPARGRRAGRGGRRCGRVAAETSARPRVGRPRAGTLGPEGRAWLARAASRADPAARASRSGGLAAVIEAFGYEAPRLTSWRGYRQAYARLRRAEALLAGGGRARAAVAARPAGGRGGGRAAGRPAAARRGRGDGRAGRDAAARRGRPAPRRTPTRSPRASGRCSRWSRWAGPTGRSAQELFISEKTVSVHLSRVMAKLGASSRTEAVAIAYERGLLSAPASGSWRVGPLSGTGW